MDAALGDESATLGKKRRARPRHRCSPSWLSPAVGNHDRTTGPPGHPDEKQSEAKGRSQAAAEGPPQREPFQRRTRTRHGEVPQGEPPSEPADGPRSPAREFAGRAGRSKAEALTKELTTQRRLEKRKAQDEQPFHPSTLPPSVPLTPNPHFREKKTIKQGTTVSRRPSLGRPVPLLRPCCPWHAPPKRKAKEHAPKPTK